MPTFVYKALTPQKQVVKGTIEDANKGNVPITKWPDSAISIAASIVSLSRISPTTNRWKWCSIGTRSNGSR